MKIGFKEPPLNPARKREERDLRSEARDFHFTGNKPALFPEPGKGLPLQPAVSVPFEAPPLRWGAWPLFLSSGSGRKTDSLLSLFEEALQGSGISEKEKPFLKQHLWRLVRAAGAILEKASTRGPVSFREVYPKARILFLEEIETSEAGERALETQLAEFESQLPEHGRILGLSRQALLELYQVILENHRGTLLEGFRKEVKILIAQLRDILRVDRMRSPVGRSPGILAADLGGLAETFLDLPSMSRILPAPRGPRILKSEDREGLEKTIRDLRKFLQKLELAPDYFLVRSGPLPCPVPSEAAVIQEEDSFSAALELWENLAGSVIKGIRTLRRAQFQAAGNFKPEHWEEMVSRLDWRSLSARELGLVSRVVVLESEHTVKENLLSSYSRLMHSGKPIQVLLSPSENGPEDGLEVISNRLSYQSIAFREAYVLQTSLLRPEHLREGLDEIVEASRPAVAFVEMPSSSRSLDSEWSRALVSRAGRAAPLFRFNPGAGVTWSDRFSLSGNPQCERVWPQYSYPFLNEKGEKEETLEAVTFAHCAAMNPSLRGEFLLLPAEGWGEDQREAAEFLRGMDSGKKREVPFIWVRDKEGKRQRAVLSLNLALAARDRLRYWRTLQELAGIENAYALRAREKADAETEAQLAGLKKDLEAKHRAEIESVRAESEEKSIDRLVSVLLDMENAPLSDTARPSLQAVSSPPSAETESAAEIHPEREQVPPPARGAEGPEESEEEEVLFDEPYIDSILCTTCNECTNLNPLLFKYNADKQAYIGDPEAGTFAELVQAAEKCPAKVIHPGAPRRDDTTVTEELLKRAAAFAS